MLTTWFNTLLACSSKTTLQWRLKTGELQDFAPTQRAKEELLTIEGLQIRAYDLGGHAAARQLWTKYCAMADGIVFMVDANEPARFEEAAQVTTDEQPRAICVQSAASHTELARACILISRSFAILFAVSSKPDPLTCRSRCSPTNQNCRSAVALF